MTSPKSIACRWVLAAAGLLGSCWTAQAAEHPPLAPTRDVMVAYQVWASQMPAGAMGGSDGQAGQNIKMSYSVASGRLRIEQASLPGYLLVDRAAGRVSLVMEPMQSFMDMPFDDKAGAGLLLNDTMSFARAGQDKVAGLACTVWAVTSGQTTARLCITEDGVILRGEGSDPRQGKGKLMATAVTFAAQPAAKFSPPPGFHRMELPPGGLPSGGMGSKSLRPPG